MFVKSRKGKRKEMRIKPYRLNICQLSERSGYSFSQIDLLIQDGIVSLPLDGYMFSARHQEELRGIRISEDHGCSIKPTRRSDYMLDWFTVA